MSITVVLAESHPVVRAGVRAWLAARAGVESQPAGAGYASTEPQGAIRVVAEAATGTQAVEQVLSHRPHVLLAEIALPQVDGLGCLAQLRESNSPTKTLFFSAQTNPTYTARAMALGAVGLVEKQASAEQLAEAIRRAAAGESLWSEQSVRRYTGTLPSALASGGAPLPSLTKRESQVLKQLAFGLSNKEIAQALDISYETVKEHVQHVLRKLGVADRTQAAVWAVRNGLA